MNIEMDVSLDPTLGCGQAHRWRKTGNAWEGVLGDSIVVLEKTQTGFSCTGDVSREALLEYFRHYDDLEEIYADMSASDPYLASLAKGCPGLRILKQDPWECTATYLLAVNANVQRIGKMVESVCDTFGKDLGGRSSFPTPSEVLDKAHLICECRLGYREQRFVALAGAVEEGKVDFKAMGEMDFEGCRNALMGIYGIGEKVADCISLFAFGHMDAFPIDARIKNVLRDVYGVEGSYAKLAEFGRKRFGKYPGYAQELLYHGKFISWANTQSGGSTPTSSL